MQKTKLTSLMKRIFIILFVCCLNSGCEKDVLSLQGNLKITFYNHPADLTVTIYSLEDKDTPIYEVTPEWDGTLDMPLNVGNYLIKPYSTQHYYQEIGLQIMQDKTTSIKYNEYNRVVEKKN